MAEITKRGNTYKVSVFLGRDKSGKKIRENTTFIPQATTPKAIEKEVDEFARSFEKRVKNGEYYDGEKMTFSAFVEVWKNNALTELTERVREEYIRKIEVQFVPAFGFMPLSKIKATHIDNVLNAMKKSGKAPKTIRYSFTAINSIMKYAFKKGIIKENPCLRCDTLPKVKKDTDLHYFTVEQARTFLKALTLEYDEKRKPVVRHLKDGKYHNISGYTIKNTIPYQYRPFFSLAIFGGFRRGELCALTWNDIDFESQSVSVNKAVSKLQSGAQQLKDPKTVSSIRTIKVPQSCINELQTWKTEQRLLSLKLGSAWKGYRGSEFDRNSIFIDLTNGLPINIDTPSHKFKEVIDLYNSQYAKNEEDKLPSIRLHDLRHTSATLLLANNADIMTVSRRLGHSKASTTLDIYAHALDSMDELASQTLERAFSC